MHAETCKFNEAAGHEPLHQTGEDIRVPQSVKYELVTRAPNAAKAGLQTNKLPLKDASSSNDSNIIADEYASLSKLFVLAEKLVDDESKKLILSAILARSKEPFSDEIVYYPALDSVQIIYEGTVEDSPARHLLVQLYANFGNAAFIETDVDGIPQEFLYHLSRYMLDKGAAARN
ncbi:hypothetical protein EK21DRAFT_86349 [Setomelanomma holmii]|uniref:Uncharacterized protein n=1 Tax=Setomelanomma holmii TaxID=210430 RepID=A0A9P4LQY5_9PLEO|nr:hypothetical protein EK21DRAFT_86349 [Setomelanomma holmii]